MRREETMNQYANFAIIRGLPLNVFVAMNLLGGHATYTQLEYWCDKSRPTIRKAMFPLLQLQLIKPVTQSKFMVNDYSEQTKMFAEKFFHLSSSSSVIKEESIDILSIESTTTTSCKSFSALPEVEEYLKSKGVWAESIPEIAKMAENDLVYLKAQFEGVDAALAVYRIKNAIPSEDIQTNPVNKDWRRYTQGKYAEYINTDNEDD